MPHRLPSVLRADEPERLLAAAASERDRLLLGLGLWAGLRVSELCALRIEDIDLDAGELLVRHGKGDKQRLVTVSPRLQAALDAWIGTRRTGWLFPSRRRDGPVARFAVNKLLNVAARKAGVKRALHPHQLRHTFATELLRKGANLRQVQMLLGHSSPSVTQIYTFLDTSDLRRATDLLG